ncbi:hypothetical protein [Halomonas casei]|uniref:hypothetical protein n=1 Tax=Halomonas casei TaxID=2742613 RepID=UPI0039EF5CC4
MFNTNPKEVLPPMRAGERESRAGGEQYCLSPLPLPTDSEYAVDVAHIDVRHDDVTMDIRQGASPDSMMTAGHILSGLVLVISSFCLILFLMVVIKNTMYGVAFAVWGGGSIPFFFLCLFLASSG